MANFVHIHTHSDYSTLDGAQKISTIVNKAVEMELPAVVLTDHGNMFGAVELYNTAKKAGIKPIIGCEAYVAPHSRFDKSRNQEEGNYYHLVLLSMNQTGYHNLMELTSLGYTEGYYYKPRVDKELLKEYNEGIIATSACINGEVARAALNHGYDRAKEAALEYAEIFPGRFYLELHRHGMEQEDIVNEILIKVSKETGIPLVCANDAHYTERSHAESHDALLCIGTNALISDTKRMKYVNDEFYYKTPEEMAELFSDIPEALENTVKIADRCEFNLQTGDYHLPEFPIPDDAGTQDPAKYLEILTRQGLQERIGEDAEAPEYKDRLEYELGVINEMGFPGYFLITQDFVKWAKDQDIPVGPGRGSAAGSLVAYCLYITDINPIPFDLLFERFLNPERVSMPDIDIDFCYERRLEVVNYIKERYGRDSVCQIITFGRMKAKQVVRDVARVMGLPYSVGDRFAKAIPDELKMTLEKAETQNPEMKSIINESDASKKLWEMSLVLEGMNRNVGIHAAGVVIAPGKLTNWIPIYKSSKDDITTQYDMKCLDQVGMLKVDFLGLRTLTVIKNALKLLEIRGISVDIDKIPLDDQEVYRLFSIGKTFGLFQFESGGMREYLRKLKPNRIEDLVAMNALYRPGPMDNIPSFIDRKHGKEPIVYLDKKLEPILKTTYGIIVYQEQVMQIVSAIADFSLGRADVLRRAMGKKKLDVMEEMRVDFNIGAKKNDVSEKVANEIYDLLIKFASYGFNKSHSVAYAYIAYQTGYLKAHYPAEFMAANMTSERNNIKRVVELIQETKKLDIEIIKPDINTSTAYFSVLDGKITYGMSALKSMGEKAANEVAKARAEGGPFKTIFDFSSRVDLKSVNRKSFEALINAGAMDSLEGNRSQLTQAIDMALKYGQRFQEEKDASQISLFGGSMTQVVMSEPKLEDLPDWASEKKLGNEKEFIGFYLTGHPLEAYQDELETLSNENILFDDSCKKPETVRLGGLINGLKIQYDKRSNQYARFQLLTLTHEFTVLSFKSYQDHKEILVEDAKIFLEGKLSNKDDGRDEVTIFMDRAKPLDNVRHDNIKAVHLRLFREENWEKQSQKIAGQIARFPGSKKIFIHISERDTEISEKIICARTAVNASREFISSLREIVGSEQVWMN